MQRFLVLAGVCLWLISVVGCGGDDSTPVDDTSSEEERYSEDYDSEEGSGSEGGGEGDYSGGEEEGESYDEDYEEGYGEEDYEEGMDEEEGYGEEEEDYEEGYEEGMGEEEGYGEEEEGGYGSGRSGAARPQRPVTLADKSQAAFAEGRDKDALQYQFANAVIADEAAATGLLGKMGWLGPAKRPAMAVKWGVGIEYTAPKDYKGSAYPIGTSQSNVGTGNRGGGGGFGDGPGASGMQAPGGFGGDDEEGGYGSGGMGRGGAGGGAIDAQLKQLTGELGESLVAGLRERIAEGEFGKILADATSGGSGRRPGSGYGSGGYDEYGEDEGSYDEGTDEDGYGEEEGGGYGGYGQARRQKRSGAAGAKELVSLAPGVAFLGVADAKVLKEQAKEAELDVLCVFEVAVKFNIRQRTIINETTIAVYDVLDDKRAGHETKKMNNIQVQVARANNDTDVVEKEMEELFEYIDNTWLMTDLPAGITQEAVLNRLRPLITEPQANPLPILAEIRMYRTRGLIKDEHYAIACKGLLGEQVATVLITGTDEEKKQAIEKWLPKEN